MAAKKQKKTYRYMVRDGRHVEVYQDPGQTQPGEEGYPAEAKPGLGGYQMVYFPGEVFETTREISSEDTKFMSVSDATPLTYKDIANLPEYIPNGDPVTQGKGTSHGHGLSEVFKDSPEYGKKSSEQSLSSHQATQPTQPTEPTHHAHSTTQSSHGHQSKSSDEDLDDMTLDELHGVAKKEGTELHGATTKHDIAKAIKAGRGKKSK